MHFTVRVLTYLSSSLKECQFLILFFVFVHSFSAGHVRLSVCLVGILTVTLTGAACDVASIHFGLTIRRTDIFVV